MEAYSSHFQYKLYEVKPEFFGHKIQNNKQKSANRKFVALDSNRLTATPGIKI